MPLREEGDNPLRAKDSGALPGERLRGSGSVLCPTSLGGGACLEDWNLNAIVFDFVTFLLGRVSPPFLLLSMVPVPPCHGVPLPHSCRGVLMLKCEEISLCART